MALLHDAAEAYLGDVVRPLKNILKGCEGDTTFDTLEQRILWAVMIKYGLEYHGKFPQQINIADNRMLATENRDLLIYPFEAEWVDGEPYPERVEPWGWREAEYKFLKTFNKLTS